MAWHTQVSVGQRFDRLSGEDLQGQSVGDAWCFLRFVWEATSEMNST
ncbi:unnamed protein product [Ixodes persulcatus]